MTVFLRTGLAPHLQLGLSEAEYVADPTLAEDIASEIRVRLRAEDQKAKTPRRR